jgi:hypothetical protein
MVAVDHDCVLETSDGDASVQGGKRAVNEPPARNHGDSGEQEKPCDYAAENAVGSCHFIFQICCSEAGGEV